MNVDRRIDSLKSKLENMYRERSADLLFHGWHHIIFVWKKSIEFAEEIQANRRLVEPAALTHDINYMVQKDSGPEVGEELRKILLGEVGYSEKEIEQIESIILQADTAIRGEILSNEAKALSDADTLFKSLPITPIMFASKYISENNIDIYKLAHKVVCEQNALMEQDIYFYTKAAKDKYLKWAKTNLQLWNNVMESFQDEDVNELLSNATDLGAI